MRQEAHGTQSLPPWVRRLIAEMMIDYAKEEDKISSEVGGDPLLKLKSRELDLKAKADQEKSENYYCM